MSNKAKLASSKDAFANIPWAYRGRRTPLARLSQSIVPVGNKESVPGGDLTLSMPIQDPAHEDWVMDIQGTAFQVGEAKLLTCWHVCEALQVQQRRAYYEGPTTTPTPAWVSGRRSGPIQSLCSSTSSIQGRTPAIRWSTPG